MSQATNWSVPLVGPCPPDEMADRMDKSFDALLSSHSGSARPAYAVAGMEWVSTATAGKLKVYRYDGASDRLIMTVDTTTGVVTYEPINMGYNAITNPAGLFLQGFLSGLTLSNNTTDATNDIDIAVGSAASDGATPVLMTLASGLTKRLDASWSVGTNQGGLDTGSVGDNTYHVFLIQRSDTGVVDVLFSLSATSPTMPTNYDRKRRIGSILRTGGANRLFIQVGNRFMLAGGAIGIRNSTAATSGGTLVTTVAPFGIRVQPLLTSLLSMNSSSTASNWISDGDGAAANFIFQNVGAGQLDQLPIFSGIYTDLSARINWSTTIGAGTIAANVLSSIGWIDSRGING